MAKPVKKEKEVTKQEITNTTENTIKNTDITENTNTEITTVPSTTSDSSGDYVVSDSTDSLAVSDEVNMGNTDKNLLEITSTDYTNTDYTDKMSEQFIDAINPNISKPEIDINSLLSTIQSLQKQVEELTAKQENNQKNVITQQPYVSPEKTKTVIPMPVPVNNNSNTPSETTQLLNYLANKKSDKEVTIVHNMELSGGLSTAIQLTGLAIDFHTMGEQRVLSFQQFEECVSKYLSWFNKKIILLSYEDRELAERYNIPYVGQGNYLALNREMLTKVGKMTVEQLQEFYLKLCPEDQDSLCYYWIGKCYERAPDFYNRYKIECLNRLSNKGAFDNILVNMNNDFMKDRLTTNGNTNVANSMMVNGPMGNMGQKKVPLIEAVDI